MIWWPKKNDPLALLADDPVSGDLPPEQLRPVLDYLSRFGYLASGECRPRAVGMAVRAFRQRFGLTDAHSLDGVVLRAMSAPRCGLPDHRLASEEARWRKTKLSYFVESYVGGLSRGDQDDLLALAWKDWMAVCGITVTPTTSRATADIVIGTGRGRQSNFDGPSGTLAWAYLPNGQDGQLQMRFDLDETWTRSATDRGVLYRNVACHELGHLLGLDHSQQRAALMAPYYAPGVVTPQPDDARRARDLYGPATTPPPPPAGKVRLTLSGPLAAGSYDVTAA